MTTLTSTDPRTGTVTETGIGLTDEAEVSRIAERAASAVRQIADRGRGWRSELLRAMARETEAGRELLVATAAAETGLTEARLNTELTRCVLQFELFADAVDEGSFLEAMIDHSTVTPLGPAPDIRRILRSIGPVAIFGSSNFPFAFSVLGGDTAAAVAAGSPVILKAHGSHPLTSRNSFDALLRAARSVEAPEGVLSIVYGQRTGAQLVAEPAVKAVGFTGSLEVGRLLADIAARRPEPIPFYGELSSINPVVITADALAGRADTLPEDAAASVAGSGGQLCTKPGVVFVPAGIAGEEFVARFAAAVAGAAPHAALSARVLDLFDEARGRMRDRPGTTGIEEASAEERGGSWFSSSVLRVDAADLTPETIEEAFGPFAVVVTYDSEEQLLSALTMVPPSLTATLHLGAGEHARHDELIRTLTDRSGRVVFDGFPTGVRVSWAQHHGGPWPSTNSIHSSVGVTSMRRFLTPVAYQNAPTEVLPTELHDDHTGIPRRIDGILQLAAAEETS
ncbi:aldehyde dehydrogenase family protein [Microbacterium sp.]|uniref:aldehyde dehydrogenase family protein n=1 Tax=Microbacterium sp. TaxID=51671 RepID=UPI0035654C07